MTKTLISGEIAQDAPAEAAIAYEMSLRELGRTTGAMPLEAPVIDLVLLGIGSNGHTASLFPHSAALRVEERQLQDEKRTLEMEEAELLSPQRLENIAQGQNLVAPFPGQVVRLNVKGDSAVAMVK